MTVPHYEEEYDESLTENMAAELGANLAGFVDGDDILTPNLQQALVRASHAAKQERKSLDWERDTLTDARRRLRDVSESTERLVTTPLDWCPFDKLLRVEHRLQNLKTDCEEILKDRQRDLQKRHFPTDVRSGAKTSL